MYKMKLNINECKIKENKQLISEYEYEDIDSIIIDICSYVEENSLMSLEISGFGSDDWRCNCKFELPCILEQMVDILTSFIKKSEFKIDFYEQGMERKLKYKFDKSEIIIACESYDKWKSNNEVYRIKYNEVFNCFREIFKNTVFIVEKFAPEIRENKIFLKWSYECNKKIEAIMYEF